MGGGKVGLDGGILFGGGEASGIVGGDTGVVGVVGVVGELGELGGYGLAWWWWWWWW